MRLKAELQPSWKALYIISLWHSQYNSKSVSAGAHKLYLWAPGICYGNDPYQICIKAYISISVGCKSKALTGLWTRIIGKLCDSVKNPVQSRFYRLIAFLILSLHLLSRAYMHVYVIILFTFCKCVMYATSTSIHPDIDKQQIYITITCIKVKVQSHVG